MADNYLNYTDDAAFIGLEKKQPQPKSYWHPSGLIYECPKCRGFGGWIISLNQYGDGKHFMASCNDCTGWGYTGIKADHPHQWDDGTSIGHCLHRYTCKVCGITSDVDSSD